MDAVTLGAAIAILGRDAYTVESVTGTTPSITGSANSTYKCGEVLTINIVPPADGTIEVVFTSGTTPTLMTVPNTVKWPEWFEATALEANTIYDIIIMDGTLGGVMTWTV